MSATAEQAARARGISILRESNRYRLFVGVVALAAMATLFLCAIPTSSGFEAARIHGGDVLVWTVLVGCTSCLPISSGRGAWLSLDLPLLLAAGFVFGPAVAGAIGLLGAWDMREIRREISPTRAIFNRSQVALSAMAGVLVFEAAGGTIGSWPGAGLAAILGLIADSAVNYSLVAMSTSITHLRPFTVVLKEMRLGSARSFVPSYLALGLVAILIAEAYASLGIAGVLASIAPVLLARQAFQSSHMLNDANELLQLRERALDELDSRVASERRDERLLLAGEIHDEVLPPLFKVHLMGQVLKQDLSSGRLLDLDEDLPQLLEATEVAQSAIRDLLGDLRRSPLGAGGLLPTVRLLADRLESVGSPRILLHLQEIEASPQSQLLAYQVVREAMNNAAKYSNASAVEVKIWGEEDMLRVLVEDDGVGFDPRSIDKTHHFGLQLISERVLAAGGQVVVDSRLGSGTLVVAALPMALT
jgi:signal transduction histidine kinase